MRAPIYTNQWFMKLFFIFSLNVQESLSDFNFDSELEIFNQKFNLKSNLVEFRFLNKEEQKISFQNKIIPETTFA